MRRSGATSRMADNVVLHCAFCAAVVAGERSTSPGACDLVSGRAERSVRVDPTIGVAQLGTALADV